MLLRVNDIEPAAKGKMSQADKLLLQEQLLHGMRSVRRRAFRGPVVIGLDIATSGAHPNYAHHIAKNVLDLLWRREPGLPNRRGGLVIADDRFVDGLLVRCEHRLDEPSIYFDVRRRSDFVRDLQLASVAEAELEDLDEERQEDSWDWEDDPISKYQEVVRDKQQYEPFGQGAYRAMLDWTQREAQEFILGKARLRVNDLKSMLGGEGMFADHFRASYQQLLNTSPVRIQLDELPEVEGTTKVYKEHVEAAIKEFRERFGVLIPLRAPVGLEIVVKPSRRGRNVVDLDNVARNYVVPRVLDLFKPPSDLVWAIDTESTGRLDSRFAAHWEARKRALPKTTKIGLTRYEAWRVPRAVGDTSPGFISVALVADPAGVDDVLTRCDRVIDKWLEAERDGRLHRRATGRSRRYR